MAVHREIDELMRTARELSRGSVAQHIAYGAALEIRSVRELARALEWFIEKPERADLRRELERELARVRRTKKGA